MEAVQSGSHTQRRRTTEAAVAFQNIQGTVFVFDKLKQDVSGQSDGRGRLMQIFSISGQPTL
jgi:hypothetical protein